MKNTYIYDTERNILRICGNPVWSKPNTAVRDFCEDYNIKLENFNLPVEIDSSVIYCEELFKDCRHFNQKVVIPDGVKDCTRMFYHCESFNQPVMLPESIETVYDMFYDCKAFNQEIKIPDCVSNSCGMFMGCESLNQPIQLLSTGQCCCEDIFVGCSSLLTENVTIYSRKISKKNLEKKLQKMWGIEKITEEIMEKTNIITVKTKEKIEIKNISYSFGHKVKNITDEQLKEMSLQEIHKQLEKMYRKGNLTGLEISAKSDDFMHTLCIYFDKTIFCIGIMDDWKETALLYDSGEGEEPVVIRGNYYPKHMVSDNEELLFMIVDEFLQYGKPTKKVKWTKG